ncbi:hypothetical protein QTG54_013126 [Skeletonema marinoi]|uniref:Uncharacterized protein n=1 Tax=Skeletonema marinoi TaxID=267567 RepID=A0AAD9D7R0_9STRA|nr:hypothetical protein QTG54_013126 [Skeletonema marinoi]
MLWMISRRRRQGKEFSFCRPESRSTVTRAGRNQI